MRLRICNYNKISHSNKLQSLNEARLYTFLVITCGQLDCNTNIKVQQYSKALRIPINGAFNALNAAVNALYSVDFDGALFNFRIFFKLRAPTCLGPVL